MRRFTANLTLVAASIATAAAAPPNAANAPHGLTYASCAYSVELDPAAPRFTELTVDSGGLGYRPNAIRLRPPTTQRWAERRLVRRGPDPHVAEYTAANAAAAAPASWTFAFVEDAITIRSRFVEGVPAEPMTLRLDPKVAHATLLGRMPAERQVALPCVMHLPDGGTFRVTCDVPGVRLDYDARRFVPEPFVEVGFPAATPEQPSIGYRLEVVTIIPPEADTRPGAPRYFLNLFQLNPRLRALANNAASDPVAFTVYKYADLAAAPGLPPLADGLTALDLVRATLDRYLAGMKGYGQVGYRRNIDGADTLEWASPFDALDTYPSLLSAACTVTTASKDFDWARRHWPKLREWADRMLATDKDANGLLEYGLSGNSGSWSGKGDARPSNWWDQIGFGHEDAYANALAYRALAQLAALAKSLDEHADAARFAAAAQKLRAAYLPAFYSKQTGLIAGWRSADGHLHDYAFTFVTACAVCWDLVDHPDADRLMTTLLARLKTAGFTNFRLGLPGNLIPIRRADYVTLKKRWGGPEREDGSDTFGIFENGGATHAFAYFAVKALFKLDRAADARALLHPMIDAIAAHETQGRCPNGHTKEWRDWQGNCWGYEGFLTDAYLVLLATLDDKQP